MANKNIDTSLGFSVTVEDAPKIQSIGTANYQLPLGETGLSGVAKALKEVSPRFWEMANEKKKKEDQENFELGRAKINGITLEEARQAHKEGFPDLYNDWAKYGAKVQYATNAVDQFQQQFRLSYLQKKEDPNYSWTQDWQQQSQIFMSDKQGDKEFAKAFNEGSKSIRSFIDNKEYERQSEQLTKATEDGTLYQLQNVGTKVATQLLADFPKSVSDITKLGEENYKKEQAKFIAENYKKYFKNEFNNIKNIRPANISLSKFDDIVLQAMTDAGNRNINPDIWLEVLQDVRDDGTPPLIANKAKGEKVQTVYKLLTEAVKTGKFEADFMQGKATTNWSSSDHNKYGDKLWEQKVSQYTAINNGNKIIGMQQALDSMHTGITTQRPIKRVEELFKAPIGRDVTQDNLTTLALYQTLDKKGLTGIYFPHSSGKPNVDALKWFYVSTLVKNGVPADKALLQVGRSEANSIADVKDLDTQETTKLGEFTKSFAGTATPENFRFVKDLALYFKSTTGSAGDYIKMTKDFLETNYVKVPNSSQLVPKNVIATLGINLDEMKMVKEETINLLNKKYGSLIAPSELGKTNRMIVLNNGLDETDVFNEPPDQFANNLSNYDLSFNLQDGYVYFKPIDKQSAFLVPDVEATVKDPKTGKMAWARVKLLDVQNVLMQKAQEKQRIENEKRLDKLSLNEAQAYVLGYGKDAGESYMPPENADKDIKAVQPIFRQKIIDEENKTKEKMKKGKK